METEILKSEYNDADDIVLLYDLIDKKWKKIEHLENREPEFFNQMVNQLSDVLQQAEKRLLQPI